MDKDKDFFDDLYKMMDPLGFYDHDKDGHYDSEERFWVEENEREEREAFEKSQRKTTTDFGDDDDDDDLDADLDADDMDEEVDEFYPVLKKHGNSIELNADENLSGRVDAEKLARVFGNILRNAVSYSYTDTPITISAAKNDENIVISVSSRGKTIPKEKLQSVFEKFFRADDARGTNTGGAGLGLAIAKEIVTLHGGEITAESENELTTFTVCIPAL